MFVSGPAVPLPGFVEYDHVRSPLPLFRNHVLIFFAPGGLQSETENAYYVNVRFLGEFPWKN